MSSFDSIDVSERIDIKKNNGSCENIIFLYWYFFEINFRYDLKVYIIAILPVKGTEAT